MYDAFPGSWLLLIAAGDWNGRLGTFGSAFVPGCPAMSPPSPVLVLCLVSVLESGSTSGDGDGVFCAAKAAMGTDVDRLPVAVILAPGSTV